MFRRGARASRGVNLSRRMTNARLLGEGRASTNNHTYPVALVCLSTGVHWDEAGSLSRGAVFWARPIFTGSRLGSRARCRYPRKSKLLRSRWPCLETVGCSCPAGLHFEAPTNAVASRHQGSYPHPTPHLRQSLHDEGRGYPQPATNPRPFIHHHDHALCPLVAGSFGVCFEAVAPCAVRIYFWVISMQSMISFGDDMASITIRNLDDDLKAQLRVVAASHGRSMEEEARVIIRQALFKPEKSGGLGSRIHARFATVGGVDLEVPARKDKARAASFGE